MNVMTALVLASVMSQATEAPSPAQEEAAAIIRQVHQHWAVKCDNSAFLSRRFRFDVRVDREGQLVGYPALVEEAAFEAEMSEMPRSEALKVDSFKDSARVAIIQAAPFDVPPNYQGGFYRVVFAADLACRSHPVPAQ